MSPLQWRGCPSLCVLPLLLLVGGCGGTPGSSGALHGVPEGLDLQSVEKQINAHAQPEARVAACARVIDALDTALAQDCHVALCADARALIVHAQHECGQDSCDGQAWVLRHDRAILELEFAGHKACAPDASFVVFDTVIAPTNEADYFDPRRWDVQLKKTTIADGAESLFAACMSPTLAPDGRGFYCRNRAGDVLEIGLAGGTLARVFEANVSLNHVLWNPLISIYPTPVRFDANQLVFVVSTLDGDVQRSVAWERSAEPR